MILILPTFIKSLGLLRKPATSLACNLKLYKCQYSNKLYRMKHYYCRTVCQNLLYEIQVTKLTVLTRMDLYGHSCSFKKKRSIIARTTVYIYPVFASILKSYNNSIKMSVELQEIESFYIRVGQSCETLYIPPRSRGFLFSLLIKEGLLRNKLAILLSLT